MFNRQEKKEELEAKKIKCDCRGIERKRER